MHLHWSADTTRAELATSNMVSSLEVRATAMRLKHSDLEAWPLSYLTYVLWSVSHHEYLNFHKNVKRLEYHTKGAISAIHFFFFLFFLLFLAPRPKYAQGLLLEASEEICGIRDWSWFSYVQSKHSIHCTGASVRCLISVYVSNLNSVFCTYIHTSQIKCLFLTCKKHCSV